MKKILVILALACGVFAMSSCSNGQKACAAYAKSDTGNQPSLSEVQ